MKNQTLRVKYLENEAEQMQSEVNVASHLGRSLNAADIVSKQHRLASLDKALGIIRNGKDGICALCNEPIDWPTLQGFPQATICCRCDPTFSHLQDD